MSQNKGPFGGSSWRKAAKFAFCREAGHQIKLSAVRSRMSPQAHEISKNTFSPIGQQGTQISLRAEGSAQMSKETAQNRFKSAGLYVPVRTENPEECKAATTGAAKV